MNFSRIIILLIWSSIRLCPSIILLRVTKLKFLWCLLNIASHILPANVSIIFLPNIQTTYQENENFSLFVLWLQSSSQLRLQCIKGNMWRYFSHYQHVMTEKKSCSKQKFFLRLHLKFHAICKALWPELKRWGKEHLFLFYLHE